MEPASHPELRVLFVEDDPALRAAVSRYLRRLGCEVTTAANGAQALRSVRRRDFDVVVTDLHMPGVDGLEFWREATILRPHLRGRFLFCSAAPDPDAVHQLAKSEHFISKPFGLDELRREVLHLAGRP